MKQMVSATKRKEKQSEIALRDKER